MATTTTENKWESIYIEYFRKQKRVRRRLGVTHVKSSIQYYSISGQLSSLRGVKITSTWIFQDSSPDQEMVTRVPGAHVESVTWQRNPCTEVDARVVENLKSKRLT